MDLFIDGGSEDHAPSECDDFDVGDDATLALSGLWSPVPHESGFNPAAHSWIIVPADCAVDSHSAQDEDCAHSRAEVDQETSESRTEAQSLHTGSSPSPVATTTADFLPGLMRPETDAPSRVDVVEQWACDAHDVVLPDGVPAWTQQIHAPTHDAGKLKEIAHELAQPQTAAARDTSIATGPVESSWGQRKLHGDASSACAWSELKWLIVTNAATLLFGFYLGHSLNFSSSSAQGSTATSTCSPSTCASISSRDLSLPQATVS